jgi:hypothetical protein
MGPALVARTRPPPRWIASHTLAGATGMSACTTQNGASAPMTEVTTAPSERSLSV